MSIVTDLSINARWLARRNTENTFTLSFTQSGAFNVSSYVFIVNIRKIGADVNSLQLTQGSGVTNGGGLGTLIVLLSEVNSDLLRGEEFFYEVAYIITGKTYTLFNGILQFYKQVNLESNPEPEFSTPIRLGSNTVTLSFAA